MNEFVELVKQMRDAQKAYFAARRNKDYALANHWFPISCDLEKQVDKVIDEQANPKLF